MKGLDELMRMAIESKEQEIVNSIQQARIMQQEKIRVREKMAVEDKYSGPYSEISLLENKACELRKELDSKVISAIKARFPQAFEKLTQAGYSHTVSTLRDDIKKINGIYDEYQLVAGDISSLLNALRIWKMKICACDNLNQADKEAAEMRRDYDNKAINIHSGINLASNKMIAKIGAFMHQQETTAENGGLIANNVIADNKAELLKQQLAQALQENEDLRKKDLGISKQNTELKKQNTELKEGNTELKERNTDLKGEKEDLRQEKKYWQEKATKVKAKNSELEALVELLKNQLILAEEHLILVEEHYSGSMNGLIVSEINGDEDQIGTAIIGNNEAGVFVEDLI